jgi:2-polyprenyl-3-methyl-5-hydroxy-6-metoxy-1,4-benzoquinol methylase
VLIRILNKEFPSANISACDISLTRIEQSKQNCADIDIDYSIQDVQDLKQYRDAQFNLVICCEVLEHAQDPNKGLAELERITSDHLFISVPHEPIWRILNMLRGKYLMQFGNTPTHLNHWNACSVNGFISQAKKLTITENLFPFPWLMKVTKKSND